VEEGLRVRLVTFGDEDGEVPRARAVAEERMAVGPGGGSRVDAGPAGVEACEVEELEACRCRGDGLDWEGCGRSGDERSDVPFICTSGGLCSLPPIPSLSLLVPSSLAS
jgi:hypothetical protein